MFCFSGRLPDQRRESSSTVSYSCGSSNMLDCFCTSADDAAFSSKKYDHIEKTAEDAEGPCSSLTMFSRFEKIIQNVEGMGVCCLKMFDLTESINLSSWDTPCKTHQAVLRIRAFDSVIQSRCLVARREAYYVGDWNWCVCLTCRWDFELLWRVKRRGGRRRQCRWGGRSASTDPSRS